ncbi:MAG TPA: undecaprenyl-diphosphate phosphatase [Candidatus Bilamarchaeaceae archaeon]|nr:undecaprenyl-diphosphate phosphatase [Candidatus Bilamarchaeaceae archaeon]
MDLIQALIVGAVQGILEWLPVSSSGQGMLILINFLQANPQAAFSLSIFLHMGTLLAVLVKYRDELLRLLLNLRWEDPLLRFLIITTMATGIIGVPAYMLLKGFISGAQGMAANALVGLLLVFTGIALHYSSKKAGSKKMGGIGYPEMAAAGVAQGIAILPGISRSGTTIASLLLMGVEQRLALKLSFLMSIPAVLGALALDFASGDMAASGFGVQEMAAGVFAAFVFGYFTMDFMLKAAGKMRFDLFCIAFGLLAVLSLII